jgi:hypothetical protein
MKHYQAAEAVGRYTGAYHPVPGNIYHLHQGSNPDHRILRQNPELPNNLGYFLPPFSDVDH